MEIYPILKLPERVYIIVSGKTWLKESVLLSGNSTYSYGNYFLGVDKIIELNCRSGSKDCLYLAKMCNPVCYSQLFTFAMRDVGHRA